MDEKQKDTIEKAAQKILDARKEYPDSTLADLYDPISMPANIRKAHTELDKLVEKSYRQAPFKDDAEEKKIGKVIRYLESMSGN